MGLRRSKSARGTSKRLAVQSDVLAFYESGKELGRLEKGIGPLELARTKELLQRLLPEPPAVVCDIGGGPGVYSLWLARLGYEVHLVDLAPLNVKEAKAAAAAARGRTPAGFKVGDARRLHFPSGFADALILHGPLYHLTERRHRRSALVEAGRVLKRNGLLLAFGITRYASTIVGLINGWVWDARYRDMMAEELAGGRHQKPETWNVLTTAFFHHPEELKSEVAGAGFSCEDVLGVEGPAWMVPEFAESWKNPDRRKVILGVARMMEKEPVMSPHIMAVGRKPKTR